MASKPGLERRQGRRLPSIRRAIKPARSRTFMCCEIAGWDILKGLPSSRTVASPVTRRARMARRVGADRAVKAVSRWGLRICISKHLYNKVLIVKRNFGHSLLVGCRELLRGGGSL